MALRLLIPLLLLLAACTAEAEKPNADAVVEAKVSDSFEADNMLKSKLVFEPEDVDVGAFTEGEDAVVYLRVRNAGDRMANIVSVTTSCGCTVAEPEQSLLMPGGFTRIKLVVDTFAKQDKVRKWVELTDDLGQRNRGWITMQVTANPHMADSGRSIFDGKCAACHFTPAEGKHAGPAIYAAVCAMCHGGKGSGAYAPKLAGHRDAELLAGMIAQGTGSRQMPAFSREKGGPLDHEQIESLSKWLSTLDE